MISEKYFHFKKRQKHLAKAFVFHPVKLTGSMIYWNYVCLRFLKDLYKNLKEIGIIQAV